jgi:serine/threonine protein phosphatase PrpC
MTDTASASWVIGGRSVRGAAHVRRDRPNQDAIGWRDLDGGAIVGAVADGHGAALHPRSARGARFAVESALDLLADAAVPPDAIADRLIGEWRARVFADAVADDDGWGIDETTPIAYGSTLIALRLDPGGGTLVQIGDGDLLIGDADGLRRPFGRDGDLVGEATHSLCSPDAHRRLHVARLVGRPVDFAMLSTDGVAKSFADDADLERIAAFYRERLRGGRFDEILAGLDDWLGEVSRRGSGDDATLLVAGRPPVVRLPGKG